MPTPARLTPPSPGTFNLRHTGGCRVAGAGVIADALLWRSDDLHGLDELGLASVRRAGIRTVIDVRDPAERAVRPSAFEALDVEIVHLPMIDDELSELIDSGDVAASSVLEEMLHSCGPVIAEAVGRLSRPGALPAAVLCTAGKDRSAVVILTVLAALGVSRADIAEDYALSGDLLGPDFYAQFGAYIEESSAQERGWTATRPQWAMSALQLLSRHGGADRHLECHGLPARELAALRRSLVCD